jgi:NAD(P)-dependent dehydrogenase (short-subunit alcohol dehydrogenase family)
MNRLLLSTLVLLLCLDARAAMTAGQPVVLVTGANRGIGYEFVSEIVGRKWNVIAAVRDPGAAKELQDLAAKHGNVTVEKLDIADQASVDALAAKYKDQPIDLLLLNAGLTPVYMSAYKPVAGMDMDKARLSFEVNALGNLRMARAFLDNVAKSQQKKLVVLSSKAGSFAEGPKMPMMYEYRGSKAALNMFMYTLSFETPKRGVILTLLSPGQVNTNTLGGMKAPGAIEAPESVGRMLKVIDSLTPADNGKFLDYADRREIAW